MRGDWTTDRGSKPEFLYLFDHQKGNTKEKVALAIMDEMGYTIYLKANIDKNEPVQKLSRSDLRN